MTTMVLEQGRRLTPEEQEALDAQHWREAWLALVQLHAVAQHWSWTMQHNGPGDAEKREGVIEVLAIQAAECWKALRRLAREFWHADKDLERFLFRATHVAALVNAGAMLALQSTQVGEEALLLDDNDDLEGAYANAAADIAGDLIGEFPADKIPVETKPWSGES